MNYEAWRISYQSSEQAARAAYAECERLRAKVAEIERQEPVFWWRPCSDGTYEGPLHNNSIERVRKLSGAWSPLYALPGAQPAPSVPEDVMRDAKRYRFLRAAKNIPISTEAARDPVVYDAAIDAAMLARAPEDKP